jgi:ribosomal protein S18 acetylase RimI-like enzyme
MSIRLLTASDGSAYQALRLLSLQTDPKAFLTTLEGERARHESEFETELDTSYHPPHFGYYGAWFDDREATDPVLQGYALVSPTWLPKQAHIAWLYNLYVNPQFRGQGVAKQLLAHIIDQLKSAGVELIFITCAASNQPALQFYRAHGFQRHGVRRDSIKWQSEVDSEIELVLSLANHTL